MQCPACPVKLQAVERTTSYAQTAWQYAIQNSVPLPVHGPALMAQLGLVAHAQACHPAIDLASFLEAYLVS